MPLTSEQINAMAAEIIQHVEGDAERMEQERQAKAKGGEEAKRKARLVGEVAAKLKMALADAVEPDDGEGATGDSTSSSASGSSAGMAHAPTTGSQHTRR